MLSNHVHSKFTTTNNNWITCLLSDYRENNSRSKPDSNDNNNLVLPLVLQLVRKRKKTIMANVEWIWKLGYARLVDSSEIDG